eukprot:TRINITY_DN151_c1_g2_i2.p1 TRINITY_DN151_c1_g2~~TRINITY_DN151_c1_g2_i2.p1  ORF type:complete len:178 (-),score=47.24 TRINITY_DN151_c1_g2_i2:729-1262(-)
MQTDDLPEGLQCPLCFELYDDPRILTCGHSFCRQCIDSWQRRSNPNVQDRVSCPICRGETLYTQGEILPPRNYALQAYVEHQKQQQQKQQQQRQQQQQQRSDAAGHSSTLSSTQPRERKENSSWLPSVGSALTFLGGAAVALAAAALVANAANDDSDDDRDRASSKPSRNAKSKGRK